MASSIPYNCNGACAGYCDQVCSNTCDSTCTFKCTSAGTTAFSCNGTCVNYCTNSNNTTGIASYSCNGACAGYCDNVCMSTCNNGCRGDCSWTCSIDCEDSCIARCSGTAMKLNEVTSYLDRASMRKIAKIVSPNMSGYLIYPGLRGNMTLFRITPETRDGKVIGTIGKKLSMAKATYFPDKFEENSFVLYNLLDSDPDGQHPNTHFRGIYSTEVPEGMVFEEENIRYGNEKRMDRTEIKRILYELFIKGLNPEKTEVELELEDLDYILNHNSQIEFLYEDIINWTWNNRNY